MSLIWDYIGTFCALIGFSLAAFFTHKAYKNESLSFLKYFGMQLAWGLIIALNVAVIVDLVTVTPKVLKKDFTTTAGSCIVTYFESKGTSDFHIELSEGEERYFSGEVNYWDNGDIGRAYCEVDYFPGSEFEIHYRIYEFENGPLIVEN